MSGAVWRTAWSARVPLGEPAADSRAGLRTWGSALLVSLLLLIPVFWQPRLQAGDLSSHIYNAWLVNLIEHGKTPGLIVVRQWTNVLFDWLLAGLFRLF